MIEIQKVSHQYGNFHALKNIDCTIPKGKVTAILGENGSGKSTLLNIMARHLKASSGTIHFEDSVLNASDQRMFAQHLACLKQVNTMNLNISVEELVAFGRFPHSPHLLNDQDMAIIDASLEAMGCTEIRKKKIQSLSGGQRQRIFIAMVLAQDTEIVLLDEPLNNLDVRHAHEVMQRIRDLCDRFGKTVVVVLHDINMAFRYTDHILCLKGGELVTHGPIDTALDTQILNKMYEMNFEICHNELFKYCIAI